MYSLAFFLVIVKNDTSSSYVLPYRTHLFFGIEDTRTYALVYIYQTPMVYLNAVHTASVCLLITLVLHVCGRMSVLSHRIRNINAPSKDRGESFDDPKIVFRDIVGHHLEIIQ